MTTIQRCPNCGPHKFQDAKYGPGKRVFNTSMKKDTYGQPRCTVCGHVIPITSKAKNEDDLENTSDKT